MKKFMGVVSFVFVAGIYVLPSEAGFGAFSKYTKEHCSRIPFAVLESLDRSPQPNCIKGARESLANLVSGRAPKNFIHTMNVALETDPKIVIAFDRLLELAQKNIALKVPFKEWGSTTVQVGVTEDSRPQIETYTYLKNRVVQALNPRAVDLKSEDGSSIESKQLLTDGSNISAKDCANDLSLALHSALSTNPNKSGMQAALDQTGTKGSNASFQFVFALFAPGDQAKIKQLFAVRAGMENISGPELKALLMDVHQIVHNYRDVLSLYNLGGMYNRLSCTQNFYTALKSILFPGNNKNCWLAIEKALNSPSTLKESLSSLNREQEQAFRKVLAARKGGIPAKIEDIKILLSLWVQVKESKTMPTSAVPFKTMGMAKSVGAYFSLNKAACANSLEKFFFALLLEETHKNCLAGALSSTADIDITFKEHSRFYKGYRSASKETSMVPGWSDLRQVLKEGEKDPGAGLSEAQKAFVRLAKLRLGQETAESPQAKQMLVMEVIQAYLKAKEVATKRYLASVPKPAQAAVMKSAANNVETTLLRTVVAMGEQAKRIAGNPKAQADFLADLEVLISALKAVQSRSDDAEHRQVFDGVIKQLQDYADKLKRESTTLAQAMAIESAATQAVVAVVAARSPADNASDALALPASSSAPMDREDDNKSVGLDLYTPAMQQRLGVDMYGKSTVTSSRTSAGPVETEARQSPHAITSAGINAEALVRASSALRPVPTELRSPASLAIGKNE